MSILSALTVQPFLRLFSRLASCNGMIIMSVDCNAIPFIYRELFMTNISFSLSCVGDCCESNYDTIYLLSVTVLYRNKRKHRNRMVTRDLNALCLKLWQYCLQQTCCTLKWPPGKNESLLFFEVTS